VSVLSASVLVRRRGSLVLAGVATLLYAGALWLVRAGVLPPQGLADVHLLPTKAILYSIFVTGVACFTAATIGSVLTESLRRAGEKLEEAAGQVADLRELNEVIVNSIQSGLLTTDAGGHVLYLNAFGESILKREASAVRGRLVHEVLGPLLDPVALRARRNPALARLGSIRPDPADLGISVTASRPPAARAATSSSSGPSPTSSASRRYGSGLSAVGDGGQLAQI
jgi:PAS domain-containing protein